MGRREEPKGAERTAAEVAALDERAYIRGCRELEERIAWHPLFDPPGAQRFIDDPRIARRLAQARAEAEPMDRARQIEELALEVLGSGPVARILALHHGNAAMKATTNTKGVPQ